MSAPRRRMRAGQRRRLARPGLFGLGILMLAATAAGQGADPRAVMTQTVLDQLAAFRRDDWAAAYTYASSTIQARFGLEAFRQMVTSGYAAIARSARATVSSAEEVGPGRGFVEIQIEGANGETVDALYELVAEQGQWRINGVLTRPASGRPIAVLPRSPVQPANGTG